MFLLIDNYDSFTYNLLHYFGELGAEVEVRRNDTLNVDQALALNPQGIVVSPGPCDPSRAGICLDLIVAAQKSVPILGVCLGHQCIAQAFGGTIKRAPKPMHGKISQITHTQEELFKDIPTPFSATRYHSLMAERESLPEVLKITAESDDGIIQGVSHKTLPIHGVQFHPESIASDHGHHLLRNFIALANGHDKAAP
jgi:anthranilate synthase component II